MDIHSAMPHINWVFHQDFLTFFTSMHSLVTVNPAVHFSSG